MADVRTSGPLFTPGAFARVIEGLTHDITEQVGQRGVNMVQAALGGVLKHPTGRYRRSVRTERARDDLAVTDSRIVYGPWLEGVSSRNSRTRFKGYQTFRRTTRRLDDAAGDIAAKAAQVAVGRLR